MRAKPEPTQLECLLDASFWGKLLVLPANARLDWKVFARCKHSSLFGHVISNEEKKSYNIDTRWPNCPRGCGASTLPCTQHVASVLLQINIQKRPINHFSWNNVRLQTFAHRIKLKNWRDFPSASFLNHTFFSFSIHLIISL